MRDENGESPDEIIEPKKKASLGAILELARNADDEVDGLEIDLEELGKDLRGKVDNIIEFIENTEARSESLKKRAKKFADKATALENRVKSLKEYVVKQMLFDADLRFNEHGIRDDKPRLSGNDFEISIRYGEQVETKFDPDSKAYAHYSKAFVRRKYEWDKPALRKALKEDNNQLDCAVLKKVPHFKFSPKG